jgi:transposase InsO family protein
MDLTGPMRMRSIQGHSYHYVLVDDYTHYKWVFFLQAKSNAFECFKKYHVLVSMHYKGTLRAIHSDRGGEFLSTEFKQYVEEQGIKHELTALHTPQQNGVAERANRMITEAACAMLQSAGTPHGF